MLKFDSDHESRTAEDDGTAAGERGTHWANDMYSREAHRFLSASARGKDDGGGNQAIDIPRMSASKP